MGGCFSEIFCKGTKCFLKNTKFNVFCILKNTKRGCLKTLLNADNTDDADYRGFFMLLIT